MGSWLAIAEVRAEAVALWGESVRGYAELDEALADPDVELVVIATPHDSHAELAVRTLDAGKHCVVDKVMALTTADADRMIAARDRSGLHALGLPQSALGLGLPHRQETARRGTDRQAGRCLKARSAAMRRREAGADVPQRPGRSCTTGARTWSTRPYSSDSGPAARLTAWLTPAPWEGVDSGGHGRIMLEFDDVLFQVESSRICRIDRPRWWIIGTEGGFVKYGIDPQEEALRGRRHRPRGGTPGTPGHASPSRQRRPVRRGRSFRVRGHWDSYYRNIAEHLTGRAPWPLPPNKPATVVRLLEAATSRPEVTPWSTIHGTVSWFRVSRPSLGRDAPPVRQPDTLAATNTQVIIIFMKTRRSRIIVHQRCQSSGGGVA